MQSPITVTEAAKRLGVSRQRASKLCHDGRITATKFHARTWMVDPVSVEAYRVSPNRKHAPRKPSKKGRN